MPAVRKAGEDGRTASHLHKNRYEAFSQAEQRQAEITSRGSLLDDMPLVKEQRRRDDNLYYRPRRGSIWD